MRKERLEKCGNKEKKDRERVETGKRKTVKEWKQE
jgi:hypothetical protein